MKAFRLLALSIFVCLLSACGKKITHDFCVKNNTPHTIDSFIIRGAMSERTISVGPYETSETFELSYERRFRLVPKVMYLDMMKYSDSSGQYGTDRNEMEHFQRKDFYKDKVNTITIGLNPENDTSKIFIYSVN